MIRRLLSVVVLGALVSVAGCGGSSSPTAPAPGPTAPVFAVSGTIIEAPPTNWGLGGTLVTVLDGPWAGYWALSDVEGRYALPLQMSGTMTLRATRANYETRTATITVTEPQVVTFTMMPEFRMVTREHPSLQGAIEQCAFGSNTR
jgi:uncharacterized protein YceK